MNLRNARHILKRDAELLSSYIVLAAQFKYSTQSLLYFGNCCKDIFK